VARKWLLFDSRTYQMHVRATVKCPSAFCGQSVDFTRTSISSAYIIIIVVIIVIITWQAQCYIDFHVTIIDMLQ
jgi:uncharacterized protein (DUF983 family)